MYVSAKQLSFNYRNRKVQPKVWLVVYWEPKREQFSMSQQHEGYKNYQLVELLYNYTTCNQNAFMYMCKFKKKNTTRAL